MVLSGRIISNIRESKMLTQEGLADQIGVSRQTIAMWETGKRLLTDSVVILTARTLELDEDHLMSITQQERLKSRIKRLEDQYGVTIIIANEQEGEMKMDKGKHTAYQAKDGVSFAITNIYKSLNYEFTDNLGNVYKPHGWSWTLEEKTREGFLVDNINPKVESISFKYWISRKILDFQFSELPIPS